ncbi:MAG: hypothetical protein HOW73_49150 [Polyangiaceae bacterium]|nr:hypothetical protein [Polyangiaceae bacterium]
MGESKHQPFQRRAGFVALLGLVVGGASCQVEDTEPPEEEEVGVAESAITVQQAIGSSCGTSSVRGLTMQIVARANCIAPGAFVEVPDLGNITFNDSVLPYLEEPARDALVNALNDNQGMSITINSMLRTVAEQLLLYRWYQNGQCGIGLAASPGNSNHETGLAFDTSQYAAWRPALEANGFHWFGSADTVHFDYAGPGAVDYKGTDVLAFQQLWNDNNPNDPIDEDGVYGPQTEARLLASPADGFPNPVECDEPVGDRPDIAVVATFEGSSDTFADGPSVGIVDLFETIPSTWTVLVDNVGAGAAADVTVAVELDAESFDVDDYAIERRSGAEAPFEADPASNASDNPPHNATLNGRIELHIGGILPGEQKRVSLSIDPLVYSVDKPTIPALKTWIAKVDDLYAQVEFGGEVTNVDGSQTFGGGRLEIAQQADIYSRTHWEWESPRLEGVSGVGGVTFASTAGSLQVQGGDAGGAIALPPSSLSLPAGGTVHLKASRTGGMGRARLLVAHDSSELDGAESIDLDIADDGVAHEVTVQLAPGSVERIALSPFSEAPGTAAIDFVRIEGAVPVPDDDDGGDDGLDDDGGDGADDIQGICSCIAVGRSVDGRAGGLGALALGLIALGRRRRDRSRR